MAHTPALTFDQIKVGDKFTFDGDTTQDPCTVTGRDDKGGTVTLESSRTGASHPYAPEFLSKVATRTPNYRVLFTPTIWIDPATGEVSIDFCESYQYAYDFSNNEDVDDGDSAAGKAVDAADRLLFDLGAIGGELTGYKAAEFFRTLATHIADVEGGK